MIRLATQDDIAEIVVLAGHFIHGTSYSNILRFDPEGMSELVARVLEVGVIFVAPGDGRLDGFIAGIPCETPHQPPMLDEVAWWVEPAKRSGRIGLELLAAFEAWAVERELEFVKMIAPEHSDVGRFYVHSGYAPIETVYVKRVS